MKCDLHVHSYFSGLCTTPIFRRFCRESYSDPEAVHAALSRRGMNLVTLTDHDSIDGAEHLRRHSNFFLSEELTCRMPSGTEVHVGVYDFHERQHGQLQQRRNDFPALLAYLSEERLFFSINHVFSAVTGRRELSDFEWFRDFPAIETINGHMLERANTHAARLARQWAKIQVAGSDAHALPSAGTAYTEVTSARNKDEFFAGLRAGAGHVHGRPGNFAKLAREVLLIGTGMMREMPWTRLLAPLAPLVPVVTLWNYCEEISFSRRWAPQVLAEPCVPQVPEAAKAYQTLSLCDEHECTGPLLAEAAFEECT